MRVLVGAASMYIIMDVIIINDNYHAVTSKHLTYTINSGTDRPECQSKEGGGLEGGGCRNARETQRFGRALVGSTA